MAIASVHWCEVRSARHQRLQQPFHPYASAAVPSEAQKPPTKPPRRCPPKSPKRCCMIQKESSFIELEGVQRINDESVDVDIIEGILVVKAYEFQLREVIPAS